MGFFEFPHTRTYDNDLGWLIRQVIGLKRDLTEFINFNTIKYADPIAWNITTQYEGNTVVINPADGTAYISTKPVPSGVSISNTGYWTPIFNYGESINELRAQIAEGIETGLVTSAAYSEGALLWWHNNIYKAIRDIAQGEPLSIGYNIRKISVETWVDEKEASLELYVEDVKSGLEESIDDFEESITALETKIADRLHYVDTVQELIEGNYAAGEYVRVGGYYGAGDGGDALYRITEETTGGGSAFPSATGKLLIANSFAADIISGSEVSANAFGMSPSQVDNSPMLNAAVQYALNTGRKLTIKTATYAMATPVYIGLNKDYTGSNRFSLDGNLATLQFASEDGIVVYTDNTFDPARYRYFANVVIENLSITRPSAGASGYGLKLGSVDNKLDGFRFIEIRNIIVQQFFYAFGVINARHINFSSCVGRTVKWGIAFGSYADINGEPSTSFAGDCVFSECEFDAERGMRFLVNANNVSRQTFSGVCFDNTYFYGGVQGQNYIAATGDNYRVVDWVFSNCRFDQLHATVLSLQSHDNNSLKGDITMEGCFIIGVDKVVVAYSVVDLRISNNHFQDVSSAPVTFGGGYNNILADTTFWNCAKSELGGNNIRVSGNTFRESSGTYDVKIAGCTQVACTDNTFDKAAPIELGTNSGYNISGNASPGVAVNQYA